MRFAELTWEEVAAADKARLVAILPVGALEAHGPHLPLGTDILIAEGMAARGAQLLEEKGFLPAILPALPLAVADYAAGFAGTISLRPETAAAVLADLVRGLAAHGVRWLLVANAHLDPSHIASLGRGLGEAPPTLRVVFPDVTRKPWALRLTEEFKSGACHAGQYEGSLVLALRPDLVREPIRAGLPPNPASLSQAIRAGQRTFEEAGGPRAYFGDPAAASAAEGRETLDVLGGILADAFSRAHDDEV
jgi:creatinine amidohydrolase